MQHKVLASGQWQKFSLMEQLGNVGSEVSRAAVHKEKDVVAFKGAMDRALELMDFTIQDPRWRGARLREILRAREVLADAFSGGREYGSTLEDMDKYFFDFALVARMKK